MLTNKTIIKSLVPKITAAINNGYYVYFDAGWHKFPIDSCDNKNGIVVEFTPGMYKAIDANWLSQEDVKTLKQAEYRFRAVITLVMMK